MPKVHWGSLAIGVALGMFVLPAVIGAVKGRMAPAASAQAA